jgi:hypothetical protein
MFENCVDWAISSEAPNRRTFNDYPGDGSRDASDWYLEVVGTLMGEDIVFSLSKR